MEPIGISVPGGELRAWTQGDGDPTAILIHGITASAMSFRAVADSLPAGLRAVAVDLRGRGDSAGLPGPYGMRAHADDIGRVLDHLGVERAVIAGHSMGAYVATTFAADHPDRVDRVVLIDGGFPLPVPEGVDPDAVIEAVVGPAIARLSMTFESVASFFEFFRAHPALGPDWSPYVEDYLRYDLTGEPPELHSRVSVDAVRTDGRELIVDQEVVGAFHRVSAPMLLLRADRGLMNEPGGLVPRELATALAEKIPHLTVVDVPNVNHYTMVLGDGARTAARAVATGRP